MLQKNNSKNKNKIYAQFLGALLIVVVVFIAFYFNEPLDLIKSLGVTNSYISTFILGIIAGIVFLTSAFFYTSIVGFVLAGLNPVVLGILGGLGLFVSDIFIFYLGKKGRQSFDLQKYPRIGKFSMWLIRQPYWLVVVFVILYGLTPLPNEILMLTLSVLGYSFKKVWLPIMLADIAIVTAVAYLSLAGIELFI